VVNAIYSPASGGRRGTSMTAVLTVGTVTVRFHLSAGRLQGHPGVLYGR